MIRFRLSFLMFREKFEITSKTAVRDHISENEMFESRFEITR